MAKIITKIELSEKDLLALIAEKYNLKLQGARISVYKYDGDQREPSYTTITVEGEKSV
ncbi:MAG: hypothetical protein WCY77_10030 [Weeksellaceae bacterium]